MNITRSTVSEVPCESVSPIDSQMKSIHAAIDELDMRIDRVQARLEMVSGPAKPPPSNLKDTATKVFVCPFEERLAEIRERIEQQKNRISDITSRIAL